MDTPVVILQPNQQNELVKFSESAAAIEAFRKKATGLKVKDVKDTKGLALVRETRLEIKRTRVALVEHADKLKEEALAWQRRVNSELTPLVAAMKELEAPLQAEEDRIEAEKERLAEEKIQARIDELGKYHCIYDYAVVKKMSTKDFEKFAAEAKKSWEIAEFNRMADEKKRKEDEEALKKEQEKISEWKEYPIIIEANPLVSKIVISPVEKAQEHLHPHIHNKIMSGETFSFYVTENGGYQSFVFNHEKINEQVAKIEADNESLKRLVHDLRKIEFPEFFEPDLMEFVEMVHFVISHHINSLVALIQE